MFLLVRQLNDQCLNPISCMEGLNLRVVNLKCCDNLTNFGLEKLCAFQKSIVELDISYCRRMTNGAVLKICENLPKLKILRMTGCTGISDVS